jgi:hypothetical protein
MHLPSMFVVLVYVGGYLILLLVALSFAAGVYFLTQIVEEYTIITKRILRVGILVQLVLHFLLSVYEGFPGLECSVGFAAHLTYLLLLAEFPAIKPLSVPFILSCGMLALDNIVWFRFFHLDVEILYRYRLDPALAVFTFFITSVWLVPMGFAVSLTVNDNVLPSSTTQSAPAGQSQKKKVSRNIFAAVLEHVIQVSRRLFHAGSSREIDQDILSSSGRRLY